jgi:XTP/dITP diphosphohydrolase
MNKLLIATTNQGKIAEIAALLVDLPYEVIGLADLPYALPEVEETGATFAENALLKAAYYHTQTGWLALADDSGLEVDALGGRPGVHSARYAGTGASDADKVAKLLAQMASVPEPERSARFVCVIALVGQEVRETFTGLCEGKIATAPRGDSGFGYDPVFIMPNSARTFAELARAEKSAISHRGLALRQVRDWLNQSGHTL